MSETGTIPAMEEQVIVEKRCRLNEEVRVTKQRMQIDELQHITIQEQHVSVARLGPAKVNKDENGYRIV